MPAPSEIESLCILGRLMPWIAAVLLTACAAPSQVRSSAEIPAGFEHQIAVEGSHHSDPDWYQAFGSDELVALIAQAQSNNLDIAAAQARVRQANARARAAHAAFLPEIDATGNITNFRGRADGQSAHETDWSALLSVSYEVDFWGRNRATADAAGSLLRVQQADRDTLAITTSSSVANLYFQVLSLRERIRIAHLNLDLSREMMQAIQSRFDAGIGTPIEVATQRAAVAANEIAIPTLEQQEVEARAALALVVGQRPEGFEITGAQLTSMAEPPIGAGIPSDLLVRRPDIYSAEYSLRAAHADLVAARAALFPTLSLTASGGIQNPAVQAAVITLAGTGPTLTLGASFVQSIFDGGRRRAVRDEAAAKEEELLASYRMAILSALVDVENALAAIQHFDSQKQAQAESLAQSERAFEGARLRYREGAADYLTLFESQRALYAARDQYSQYRLARLQAFVTLGKALGGGWQAPDVSLVAQ